MPPTIKIAEAMDLTGDAMGRLTCPTCGVQFYAYSAEDFAFNSDGACQKCQGLGTVEQIDDSKIIADENLSLEKGQLLLGKFQVVIGCGVLRGNWECAQIYRIKN